MSRHVWYVAIVEDGKEVDHDCFVDDPLGKSLANLYCDTFNSLPGGKRAERPVLKSVDEITSNTPNKQ